MGIDSKIQHFSRKNIKFGHLGSFSNHLKANWLFRSHTRMLQREEKFANRFCEVNTTADECAKKVFNAISLGKTWRKIRSNFENDIQRPSKVCFYENIK